MNLFASHTDPRLAAEALDDSRVTKMTLETAQMICTALADRGIKKLPYKPTHASHPVTQWVMQDDRNLYWLLQHHRALAFEFRRRFDKVHASWRDVGKVFIDVIPAQPAPKTFQNSAGRSSLGLDYTWVKDVQAAYRMYLRARWLLSKPVWTDRGAPEWLDDMPMIPGNDSFILLQKTLKQIASTKTTKGSIDCPRCSNEIKWNKDNHLITLECETPECLYAKEIK